MVLRLNQQLGIENLRNYPVETLEDLRRLLASDAPAKPDPRRENFYEVEGHSEVFYIHVSPINGKVILLGIWPKQGSFAAAASHQTA